MSIIVKGVEMPAGCDECPLMTHYPLCGQTWCRACGAKLADNFETIPFDGKPDWCPLVELPKEHGRLFDETETKKVLEEIPDCEDKVCAIALLEWAIEKRWCVDAEGER